jgi:MurNAc alpha-1-phosphate uridylyltransferase
MTLKTAMILAAGRGERMRPLTDSMPKPMLKVQGKPLIEYHLEALKRSGYERVVINHAWLGQQIENAIGAGDRFGLEILYSRETKALETAGGISHALPLLCSTQDDETFSVINGDIFTNFDFDSLPSHLEKNIEAHLVMIDNPSHNPDGDFYFTEQGLDPNQGHKLTFSGIAVYRKSFFAKVNSAIRPLAPMLRTAISKGVIDAQHFTGQWTDVGTPQRLTELNRTGS